MCDRGGQLVDEPSPCLRRLLDEGEQAIVADGDVGEGRKRYENAYRRAESAGDVDAMADAVLGLGGLWVHEHRTSERSIRYESRLRDVLSLLDPAAPAALRVRIRLAAETDYRLGTHQAILAALADARRSGDPVALADAANLAHHCLAGPDHGALRATLATELIEASYATGRRSDLLMGVLRQTVDGFVSGDLLVGRRLDELRGLLAQRPHQAVGYVVSVIDVMLAIRSGRLADAEALAKQSYQDGLAVDDVHATSWFGGHMVTIRWYQGRLAELLPMLTRFAHSHELSVNDNSFQSALAVAAATSGDRRTAASALAALCGNDLDRLPRRTTWFATLYGIAQAAYLINDRATAEQVGTLLVPYADRPMIGGMGTVCLGSAHHTLGMVALTVGDTDGAVEHLRTAVRSNLALANWPAVVLSRRWLAEALTARGRSGDAHLARTERATATDEATELGLLGDGRNRRRADTVTCVRQGRHWRVEIGNRNAVVDHSVGMLYLAMLLNSPRQEIPAIDLVSAGNAMPEQPRAATSEQSVLDGKALQSYRDRIMLLEHEIDDLTIEGDTAGVARATTERDWLAAEIAGATGMGGRVRSFTDDRERARIAVGKAIRRAITRVTHADPLIGDHLRQTIHTGNNCSYLPA